MQPAVPQDTQLTEPANRYSREFKLEAVRRLQLRTQSATQLAQELGIKRSLLYRWRQEVQERGQAAAFGYAPSQGSVVDPRDAEIRRLRQQLESVSEERDILKKAQAYFKKHRP